MHYPLMQLDTARAVLADGLVSYGDKEKGTVIRRGDRLLMSGGRVFIPWNPKTEEKIYHYNTEGGQSTWKLPASWQSVATAWLYRLGDTGRTFVAKRDVYRMLY